MAAVERVTCCDRVKTTSWHDGPEDVAVVSMTARQRSFGSWAVSAETPGFATPDRSGCAGSANAIVCVEVKLGNQCASMS
jgi:hypothetical protein